MLLCHNLVLLCLNFNSIRTSRLSGARTFDKREADLNWSTNCKAFSSIARFYRDRNSDTLAINSAARIVLRQRTGDLAIHELVHGCAYFFWNMHNNQE